MHWKITCKANQCFDFSYDFSPETQCIYMSEARCCLHEVCLESKQTGLRSYVFFPSLDSEEKTDQSKFPAKANEWDRAWAPGWNETRLGFWLWDSLGQSGSQCMGKKHLELLMKKISFSWEEGRTKLGQAYICKEKCVHSWQPLLYQPTKYDPMWAMTATLNFESEALHLQRK